MKKVICTVCLIFMLVAGGCTVNLPEVGVSSEYEYEYRTTAPVNQEQTTQIPQQEETTAESVSDESTAVNEITTAPVIEPETTQVSSQPSEPGSETTEAVSIPAEMELSISMPDKNGTMVTEKFSDNKFIKLISEERGIDSDLLVAVFAVPESGQNYVFEFTSSTKRTADALRRVYLIDADGAVTGVAASKGAEKENLSAVENWFCMNVLIKGVIFPAIANDLK